MPSPQQLNDVRLRRVFDSSSRYVQFPAGYRLSVFQSEDAAEVHRLLVEAFDDEQPDFSTWRDRRTSDSEFDPRMVFLVRDGAGRLVGVLVLGQQFRQRPGC